MSGRPALIRQRDAKQIIKAAKQAGCAKVEMKIGETAVIIHLNESEKPDASIAEGNEWLTDDAPAA